MSKNKKPFQGFHKHTHTVITGTGRRSQRLHLPNQTLVLSKNSHLWYRIIVYNMWVQMQEWSPQNKQNYFESYLLNFVTSYNELQRPTMSYNELQRATTTYNDLQWRLTTSYNDLQRVITSYNELQRVTTTYNELQRATTCYNELQRATTSYNDLQWRLTTS